MTEQSAVIATVCVGAAFSDQVKNIVKDYCIYDTELNPMIYDGGTYKPLSAFVQSGDTDSLYHIFNMLGYQILLVEDQRKRLLLNTTRTYILDQLVLAGFPLPDSLNLHELEAFPS